jgi:tetratricopeptide (TPR) repeat protein
VRALQQARPPAARGFFERYLAVLAASPGAPTALSDQGDTATDAPPGLGQRDPTPAWLNLARIAEDDKQYDKALGWLQKAEGAGTDTFNARVRRAIVLGKMKRVDEGRTVLTTSTATSDDENSQLVLAEGQLLRDAGRYRESFDLLDRAAGERPKDAAVLYDTAMAAEKVDRLDAMERNLRQVIALRPEYAHAYNALGYTLADRNVRLEEARTLIEKARALAPDDAFILDSEGWLYFRLGQLPKARELLDRAWRMKPEADVAAHLGEVLWMLGERDAARKVWRDGREKDPANEGLQATLKRLKVRL